MTWFSEFKEAFNESLVEDGFNPNDKFRELVVPVLAPLIPSAALGNLLLQIGIYNLAQENPVEPCVSVDQPTVISKGSEMGNRCIADGLDVKEINETAQSLRGPIDETLVVQCGFESVVTDGQKMLSGDTQLSGSHFIQRPDAQWTVVVDGYAVLEEQNEEFPAGNYISFFQPKDEMSLACAAQFSSDLKKMTPNIPPSMMCDIHFDSLGTFNGEGYGAALMPVVGCGPITVPNPTNLAGDGIVKEDRHYNHIPRGETY